MGFLFDCTKYEPVSLPAMEPIRRKVFKIIRYIPNIYLFFEIAGLIQPLEKVHLTAASCCPKIGYVRTIYQKKDQNSKNPNSIIKI